VLEVLLVLDNQHLQAQVVTLFLQQSHQLAVVVLDTMMAV
jgi:hypothetical protein